MAEQSGSEPDAPMEQAGADDELAEEFDRLHAGIVQHFAVPFQTTVLGVGVTVDKIELLAGTGIVAICTRGEHRQAIGILDLPLPTPRPAGSEWIDTFRHFANG